MSSEKVQVTKRKEERKKGRKKEKLRNEMFARLKIATYFLASTTVGT